MLNQMQRCEAKGAHEWRFFLIHLAYDYELFIIYWA
jgi:hypothetical protein